MGTAKAAKILQIVARLLPGKIVDRVKDGRSMQLHCNLILGTENIEIEYRHDRRERDGTRLVASDLDVAVLLWPQMFPW